MLTTRRTTRGIIITICNYERYQKSENYRNDTQNETGTNQERIRNESINKNDKKEKNDKKNIGVRFKKPSVEEVRMYCTERNNGIDPETFWNHYEAANWFRGKTKIKNWKSCIITWEKRNGKSGKDRRKSGSPYQEENPFDYGV
jgi:hypothetical protein